MVRKVKVERNKVNAEKVMIKRKGKKGKVKKRMRKRQGCCEGVGWQGWLINRAAN